MTDLSYTNKNGLNLYEGFNNGFDYHRDGADGTDGYAHGGYPHIDGETSEYIDTSYKTGDPDDFFDNGNTFNIIPREDGDDGYSFDVYYTSGITTGITGYITSGTYFPLTLGDQINVEYDGVLWDGFVVNPATFTAFGSEFSFNYIGNLGSLLLRSEMGVSIPAEQKEGVVDWPFPIFIGDDGDSNNVMIGFVGQPAAHTLVITSVFDSSKTYTVEVEASDVSENYPVYCIPETNETIIQTLGVENNKAQNIKCDDTTYSGKWVYIEEYGSSGYHLILDGYESESEQPIKVWTDTQGDNEFNATIAQIPEGKERIHVEIPKM